MAERSARSVRRRARPTHPVGSEASGPPLLGFWTEKERLCSRAGPRPRLLHTSTTIGYNRWEPNPFSWGAERGLMVLRNVGLGVVVLAGVAGIAGASLISQRDALLGREFGHALAGARSAFAFPPGGEPGQAQRVVAGDEGYWLTHAEVVAPTRLTKP